MRNARRRPPEPASLDRRPVRRGTRWSFVSCGKDRCLGSCFDEQIAEHQAILEAEPGQAVAVNSAV